MALNRAAIVFASENQFKAYIKRNFVYFAVLGMECGFLKIKLNLNWKCKFPKTFRVRVSAVAGPISKNQFYLPISSIAAALTSPANPI